MYIVGLAVWVPTIYGKQKINSNHCAGSLGIYWRDVGIMFTGGCLLPAHLGVSLSIHANSSLHWLSYPQ